MSAYSDQIVADGAIGYWRLNAASGTTETDRIGTNHATISGGVTLNQGGALAEGDRAQLFDGSSGRVLMPVGVNPWSSDFTIEAWASVNTLAPTEEVVLDKESFGVNGFRMGMVQTAKWQFWTTESGGAVAIASATSSVALNTWTHLVATRLGSLFSFYVNGALIGTSSAAYVAPAGGLEVGGLGAGWPLSGLADEVAVYSSALTLAQVAAHAALGRSVQIPSRVRLCF